MYPCSMSATGVPRVVIACSRSFMCARMEGATWRSRSFSVLSSGATSLEIVGHLHPFNEHGAAFFEAAINRMSADVDAVQRDTGR